MVYFGRNERSSLQPSESRWPHRRSMRWGFVLVSNGALPRGSKLWAQSLLQDSTLEADSERQQTKVEISDPPRLCYVTYFRMWNLLFYEYSSPSPVLLDWESMDTRDCSSWHWIDSFKIQNPQIYSYGSWGAEQEGGRIRKGRAGQRVSRTQPCCC